MTRTRWTTRDMPSQAGRHAIVTGATSGLGYEAALALAGAGAAVTLAARDGEKAQRAMASIRHRHPEARLAFRRLDTASLASVRAFGEACRADGQPVDILLLNAGIGVGAVMLQRDTGVALVMVAIVAAMLFVAGLSRKIILGAAAAAVVSVPIAWNYLLADFHKERILGIFHPQEFEDLAFQQLEGLDSLGSGQIFGIGLFAENHNYVPEIYNDFIFTFIGESLGFVGCMVVVAALSFLCMRILWTGAVSRSYVGKYICTGVFAMLAFQIIVNIGMCLMVLPVIGVTLPFLSYGGTSVLSVYISLGLVMMVNGANKKHMFATS